ncbi:hypothetical protein HDU87_005608 [Geranomyces variabilis]|uniref:DUF3730 domain-containing protein n=1 Tax=Geranomyces variabilis TaxID=109894 RepID=A0AAD5TGJ9_9FUNG|nr:hypothetical protein HDU87_005608 [Geranomyces variabilis]
MDIADLRRKLGLGLRSVHSSTVLAIESDTLARPAHAWDKASPVSLLWEALLTGPDIQGAAPSAFLPAAAGEALGRLVTKGALDWHKALKYILHRLEGVPPLCRPYAVRLLFHLFGLHLQSQEAATYKCPYGQKSRRPHPLVTLVIARPDAWSEVLYEVRELLSRQKGLSRVTAIKFLDPFFTYTCLEAVIGRDSVAGQHQAMLLKLLSEACMLVNDGDDFEEAYIRALSVILLAVLRALPVVTGEPDLVQITLSEVLVNLAARSVDADLQCQTVCHLLNWVFDSRQSGRSLLPALKSLPTFVDVAGVESISQGLAPFIMAALAFVLLEVAEYEYQGSLVVSLMLEVVRSVNVEADAMRVVARTAMVPVLQALSETGDGPVKRKLFDILLILERAVLRIPVGYYTPAKHNSVTNNARGAFSVLVHDLLIVMRSKSPIDSVLESCSLHFRPFLITGLLFHARSAIRVSALAALTTIPNSTPALHMSFIPALLYVLKTDPAPIVQVQVLLRSLPALTSVNEPFVTAKVVGVVQSLLGDLSGASSGTLACVGLRALLEVWKKQGRVWPHLKGVLIGWVKRRRHGRPLLFNQGGSWENEAEMEAAVVATMRDACFFKPQDCGQDLLPHLFALIQAPGVHVATVIAALQAVNVCVQADITDPRATWNVFMMQYVMRTGLDAHAEILACLCDFYRLVAKKDDSTDLYAAFKSEIIATYLLPLQSHAEPIVSDAALLALAAFPAPDLFPVLPAPRDLVARLAGLAEPSTAASALMATFITHECVTMRRAVFKGFAAAQGAKISAIEISEGAKSVARLADDVEAELRTAWEGGRASAGLRSGLAAFTLLTTSKRVELAETQSLDLSKLPFYRTLANATRDLSLSDHPKFRTLAIPMWTRFWDASLLAAYKRVESTSKCGEAPAPLADTEKLKRVQQVESLVVEAVSDLLDKRLAEAHLPSLTVNVILSIAGLIHAASNLGLTIAPEQAARVIDKLITEYALQPEQDPHTYTDNQRGDDVQFAVALALASVTKALHANDDPRVKLVAKTLTAALAPTFCSHGHEWYQFACAHGLATLSAPTNALVSTQHVYSVCAKHNSSSVPRGFFVGLASSLPLLKDNDDTVITEMIEDALRVLTDFGSGGGQHGSAVLESASVLVSSAIAAQWVVASKAEAAEDALRRCVQIVAGMRNEESLYAELLSAYALASYHVAPTSNALLLQLTELPRSAAPSTRVAAYLALPALLGFATDSSHNSRRPDPPLLRRVIDQLRTVVVGPEPKVARVAGWVLGTILAGCGQDDAGRSDMMSAAGEAVAGNKDPADYARLNAGSSYLRAVFDALSETTCVPSVEGRNALFQALTLVDVPLPPVDWSRIDALTQDRSATSPGPMFAIAAKHAGPTSAKSSIAIYITGLQKLIAQNSPLLADRAIGIPRLLSLGGLVPEDEAPVPDESAASLPATGHVPVAVPGSKLVQLFSAAVSAVFATQDGLAHRQLALCVVPYLISDASSPTLRTSLLRELLTAYASLPNTPATQDDVVTIRALSTCFAADLDALSSLPLPKTQQTSGSPSAKQIWAVGRLAELAHLHPWIPHRLVHVAPGGPNAAVAHVVRSALAARETRQHALSALLTTVRNTLPEGSGPPLAKAILQWVVLLLDIAIVLCARGQAAGEAVEAAWQAVGAVVALDSDDSACNDCERIVQHDFETTASGSVVLAGLMAHADASEATRNQIFKRLIRLLECTVAYADEAGPGAAADVRVRIPAAVREDMRDVLLRARGLTRDGAGAGADEAWAVVWEA